MEASITLILVFFSQYVESESTFKYSTFYVNGGQQLNFTVFNFSYDGPFSTNCQFGGIAIYNIKQQNTDEIRLLCHYNITLGMSYFSETSSATIVVFNYNRHRKLNTQLQIFAASCPSINVDICKTPESLANLAMLNSDYSLHLDNKSAALHLVLNKTKCVVVKFTQKIYSYSYISCHRSFIYKSVSFLESISYKIKGIIQYSGIELIDLLRVSGKSKYLDFKLYSKRYNYTKSINKTDYDFSFLVKERATSEISLNAQYETSIHYDGLKIFMQLYQTQSSFVYVELRKSDYTGNIKLYTHNFLGPLYSTEIISAQKYELNKVLVDSYNVLFLYLESNGLDTELPTGVNVSIEINTTSDHVLEWKSYFNLGPKHFKGISLPGRRPSVILFSDTLSDGGTLTTHWTQYYFNYDYFIEDTDKDCTWYSNSWYYRCVNYSNTFLSSKYSNDYYVYYDMHRPYWYLTSTWKRASDWCSSMGGYLPSFKSKKALDEFLAFLKMGTLILEGVFIGLSKRKSSGVSIHKCTWL